LRIGLDLGGSKIEGILLGPGAKEWARYRVGTPRDGYAATIAAIVDLTARLMQGIAPGAKIGIAVPGSISPLTGLMQNANSKTQPPPMGDGRGELWIRDPGLEVGDRFFQP